MATAVSPGSEKCLADSPVVQPMDGFRVLNESEVQKNSLRPRLRNPAHLTQCLRLLLSAALTFCCLLSPRSLIFLYRRAHLLINQSLAVRHLHFLPQVHCFVDDTQLYLSLRTDDDNAKDVTLRVMAYVTDGNG